MQTKLMKKVLRNGPDKTQSEELSTAAWLIQNGYAEGNVQSDYTQDTDLPRNVVWRGITDKGRKFLSSSALKEKVLLPLLVTVFGGLIVAYVVGAFG